MATTNRIPKSKTTAVAFDDNLDHYVAQSRPFPVTDPKVAIGLEKVDGILPIRILGNNPDADMGGSEIIGYLSVLSSAYGGWISTATTVRVKAGGNANDTIAGTGARTVRITGLDANGDLATADIALAGASASASTSVTFLRVFDAVTTTPGTFHASNEGDIIIENTAGTVDFVKIPATRGAAASGMFSIPRGWYGLVSEIAYSVEASKPATIHFHAAGTIDSPTALPSLLVQEFRGIEGTHSMPLTVYQRISPLTDIWMEVEASVQNTSAEATIEMLLVRVE